MTLFKDFSRSFKDGDHSFLSPSSYHWLNYDDEKLMKTYLSRLAVAKGTELHELAKRLILAKVKLPEDKRTLSMYVNDAIELDMIPEYKMFYSKFCYGTTDAIGFSKGTIRFHDLKTGKAKASFSQLLIYSAIFFLCHPEWDLPHLKVELRIYQSNEVLIKTPELDEIVPVMDKIVRYNKILERLEEEYDGRITA